MTRYHSKLIISFLFAMFFGISFSLAQKFEGKIIINNTMPHTLNAVFTIKNDIAMMESENESGMVKMITNEEDGKKITVTENYGKKIIVIKNSNDMQYRNLSKNYSKKLPRSNNSSIKVTRETKKINGYKCYKVTGSDGRFEGEAWITKKFDINPSDLFPITKLEQRAMPRIARDLRTSMTGFVMEMTLKNIKTKKVDTMTVSIEKETISDDAFVVDMEGSEVYDEERVRELMKAAKGNPQKMKEARNILAQIRMQ